MAGFGKSALNHLVKKKVFDDISAYILLCCNQMKIELISTGKKIPNDENKIRNYLLEYYLDDNVVRRKYNMSMFHFQPEMPENFDGNSLNYEGRVDIKIMNQNEWFENRNATYIVECKRLDGKTHLNHLYVQKGIKRFVVYPPHYNSYYERNFMLGFITEKIEINRIVEQIQTIQRNDRDIEIIADFARTSELGIYDCSYLMKDITIKLRHIFSDISECLAEK